MLGYVIVGLDDINVVLGGCDTFLHSLLFPGNRSQLGRMLTYCTSLPPTPLTLAVMMMGVNDHQHHHWSMYPRAIDADDPTNTIQLKILTSINLN